MLEIAARKEQEKQEDLDFNGPAGRNSLGIKRTPVFGIIIITIGVMWIIISNALEQKLYYYPIFLIIIGFVNVIKGGKLKTQTIKENKIEQIKTQQEIIDVKTPTDPNLDVKE